MGGAVNMAARAAAAKPRRPTPAMPASPPTWVTRGAGCGGAAAGGGISRVKEGRAVVGDIPADAVDPDLARPKFPTGGRLRIGDSPPDA